MKKVIFRIISVLLGIVFALVIVESALRLLAGALENDPVPIGSSEKPGATSQFEIVAVGDSHTYGKGAPKGFSYPAQLNRILNEAQPDVTFNMINLALPGQNSSQAVEALLTHLDQNKAPDLVLFCAGHNNDHNLTHASILPENIGNEDHSHQWAYLFRNSRAFRLGQITVARIKDLIDEKGEVPEVIYDEIISESEAFLEDWIAKDIRLADEACRKTGCRLVLIGYSTSVTPAHRAMKKMARELDLPFIENYDFGLPFVSRRMDLMAPDHHPNAKGYALIALRVARGLADQGLVPVSLEKVADSFEKFDLGE